MVGWLCIALNMKLTAYDIIEPLKSLIEAKELLDKVLRYYDVYSGQFDKIPDRDSQFMFETAHGLITDTLNSRIRNYIKFDDSE